MCPIVTSLTAAKRLKWAFCGVCGRGETRGDHAKVAAFVSEHATECSAKFDTVRFMFDHSQEKPKNTRERRSKVEETEDGEKVRVVRVKESSYTLEKLRTMYPDLLTNAERNKAFAEAAADDPEADIEDYGDDNLTDYDTTDKALARIFEHYDTVRSMKDKQNVKVDRLQAKVTQLMEAEKMQRMAAEQAKKAAEAAEIQIKAMRERIDMLERMAKARTEIMEEYGFKEEQIADEISDRIASHFNSFRR
jgi:hypothetical protein